MSERSMPLRTKLLCAPAFLYVLGLPFRNELPEPWDVPDHMGNVVLTVGAAGMAAIRRGRPIFELAAPEDYSELSARFRGAVVGAGVGLVLNAIIDYKTGIAPYDAAMAPDFVDFVYGALTGPLVGATVPHTQTEVTAALACHQGS